VDISDLISRSKIRLPGFEPPGFPELSGGGFGGVPPTGGFSGEIGDEGIEFSDEFVGMGEFSVSDGAGFSADLFSSVLLVDFFDFFEAMRTTR
jgi:hypothetical protein